MIKLNNTHLKELDKFVDHYIDSSNAATGSLVDSNANVTEKSELTLLGEMFKPIQIQLNRFKRTEQMKKDFNEEIADQYIKDIEHHTIYVHDETKSMIPYCMSISLFPFLMGGSTIIGGNTEAPKHLSSFCGGFINLINQVASRVAGAVATPSFLVCFDYFARKDFGEDYLNTHQKEINQSLQHVVYYLNEPCSGRDGQSVFWNLSMFDENYLQQLYGEFVYPQDFSKVNFESVNKLQKYFLTWFNKERTKKLLTFPVITSAMVFDPETKRIRDREFKSFIAKEMSEGNAFFNYLSPNVDSLSSCCRLRNESKNEFSYTLGNVGEMTGSVHVITINMNRFVQDCFKNYTSCNEYEYLSFMNYFKDELKTLVNRLHKYHISTRKIYENMNDKGMYPIYKAQFIKMDRQFSTIGINGLMEAAEFLKLEIKPNSDYTKFCRDVLKTISAENKKAKEEYKRLFNTEMVPAENLGVKNAKWDKKDGYVVPRDCYNSYFYPVENDSLTVIDKLLMHGADVTNELDGGSAVHLNLDDYLDAEQYEKLLDMCCEIGVNYFCTNIRVTCCEEIKCGYIDKRTLNHCPKCGSKNIAHATRIIGYLRKVKNFSEDRQIEEVKRYYEKKK